MGSDGLQAPEAISKIFKRFSFLYGVGQNFNEYSKVTSKSATIKHINEYTEEIIYVYLPKH